MTNKEKIEAIKREIAGVHPYGMTEMELKIRDIIEGVRATVEEKGWARSNTEALEFMEDDQ
jgi:hypothetical protein